MEQLKDWKKITSFFADDSIWEIRRKELKIKNDDQFVVYLESLRKKRNTVKEIYFLHNTILKTNYFRPCQCSNIQTDPQPLSFSIYSLTKQLSDFLVLTLEKEIPQLYFNKESLVTHISSQIKNKIFTFTKPVLEYEYKVYLKAYNLDSGKFSHSQFVSEITNSREWILYLFDSYPVLLTKIVSFYAFFQTNTLKFIQRFASGYCDLSKVFNMGTIQSIKRIELFLGDPHKNWQNTILIEITNIHQQNKLIFYKPRNLQGDIFFNNFIKYLNTLGLQESIHATTNINKKHYGWQLGIQKNQSPDNESIKRFFHSQGINLALAYILNIQDLIADNILIRDNLPCFYDLEMIFVPSLNEGQDYRTKSTGGREYLESIIKTGLVPEYGFETANNVGYSNSGLSKISGQHYNMIVNSNNKPEIVTYAVNHKDENLPFYKGEVIPVNNYISELESGFIYCWNLILQNKASIIEYIKQNKKEISAIHTRFLVRLTYCYSEVLRKSYEPKYLSSNYEYNMLLEHLWRGYDTTLVNASIIQSEINQMHNNEVPYFFTKPSSKHLYDGSGHIIVKNYFRRSGYEHILEKISSINDNSRKKQVNILRRSLYIHNDYTGSLINTTADKELNCKTSDDLVYNIGKFLLELGTANDKYFTYNDYIINKDDIWTQGMQTSDMFNGYEGVGVFFTAFYSIYQDESYLDAAKKIFNQSLELLRNNRYSLLDSVKTKIGIVKFPISTLYYSIIANKILNNDYFKINDADLSFILRYIRLKNKEDIYYDYLSGGTGCLLVLLELYQQNRNPEVYAIINEISHHLISSATGLQEGYITWERPFFDKWGGFAHGNSAISYALFKAADTTSNDFFYESAKKALLYDQSLFDFQKQIWRKSASFEGDIHHSWGNGSAGIGLSRKLISRFFCNDLMNHEIHIAIKNIDNHLSNLLNIDCSIGSGLLGMLEIRKFLDSDYDPTNILNKYILNFRHIGKCKCGGWDKNPLITGLYYGLAGQGYNLLKLTKEPDLPSLLYV